jgi:hypothetical protein
VVKKSSIRLNCIEFKNILTTEARRHGEQINPQGVCESRDGQAPSGNAALGETGAARGPSWKAIAGVMNGIAPLFSRPGGF